MRFEMSSYELMMLAKSIIDVWIYEEANCGTAARMLSNTASPRYRRQSILLHRQRTILFSTRAACWTSCIRNNTRWLACITNCLTHCILLADTFIIPSKLPRLVHPANFSVLFTPSLSSSSQNPVLILTPSQQHGYHRLCLRHRWRYGKPTRYPLLRFKLQSRSLRKGKD